MSINMHKERIAMHMVLDKIKKAIKDPKRVLLYLCKYKVCNLIPDEQFLKYIYWLTMGKKLRLDDPKTYNEKLQWLKLYYRNPILTDMVDKITAKKIAQEMEPEIGIIPTLGQWDSFDEIDFDALPQQFVLKPNHTSGDVYICKDKALIDKAALKEKVTKWLKREYFWGMREWPYKNIKPCVFAEQFMVDESGYELKDYKFFCFDGVPKMLFIATDRGTDTRFDFYDMEFNHLPFTNGHPCADKVIRKPEGFEEMKRMAEKLSKGLPHVRVDFYNINGKIYFGEFTFFHWSGIVPFEPEHWDETIGSWINLPEKMV